MAYTVKLGALDKRINSTKQPDAATLATWDEYSVVLKEATSYDRPTLLLNADFGTVIGRGYNYAVMFGRYYWVTDLRSVRYGVMEVDLALDILATFQTQIRNTKAFIEYGSNTFDAGSSTYRIADTRRPCAKAPSIYSSTDGFIGSAFSSSGCFILQCVSGSSGVACFALSGTVLRNMLNDVATDIEDAVQDIVNLANPGDLAYNSGLILQLMGENYKNSLLAETAASAIKSIHWLPLPLLSVPGTLAHIYLGRYDTGIQAIRVTDNALWTRSGSVSIPWPVSDWRRANCQISLYVPFFGSVPVPVDQCNNESAISYQVSLDVLSGDLNVHVTCGSQTIYTGSTNVSAPYAYGLATKSASAQLSGAIQSVGGGLQMATGIVDAGAGIAGSFLGLGGGISSGIGAAFGGAQSLLSGYAQTVQPLITSAGSMGGIAALGQSTALKVTLIYYPPITDTDFEDLYGHPVFKVDTPALGFCKTRGFSISLGAEASYSSYINAVMDGGCFIEA